MSIQEYLMNERIAQKNAMINSKVHKGIRYYTWGETYFCHEKDEMCEYSFERVCCDLPDPEGYIDENIQILQRRANEIPAEDITKEIERLRSEKSEIDKKIDHLEILKGRIESQKS
jgi:hypothetical protein